MKKERLDVLLVEKGLAPSREKAKTMIMAGQVFVDNQREDKAGTNVPVDANIEIHGEPLKYVSRGGLKLEKAMNSYNLGSSEEDLLPNELPAFSTLTAQTLDDYIFGSGGTTIYASTLTYAYFAIEYENFESSSSTGKYLSNNYFVYQSFSIETINIYL